MAQMDQQRNGHRNSFSFGETPLGRVDGGPVGEPLYKGRWSKRKAQNSYEDRQKGEVNGEKRKLVRKTEKEERREKTKGSIDV